MMETQTPANISNGADPSVLTTQQLWREIGHLKELLTEKIDAINKAIELAHDDLTHVPTDVQRAVATLKDLHEIKFAAIAKELQSAEATRVEQKHDTATAVAAALSAAKEAVSEQNKTNAIAVSKSEAATTKQIDAQGTIISTATTSLESKINDLKERFLKMEGMNSGAGLPEKILERLTNLEASRNELHGQAGGRRDFWGYIIGAAGLAGAIATLIARMNS